MSYFSRRLHKLEQNAQRALKGEGATTGPDPLNQLENEFNQRRDQLSEAQRTEHQSKIDELKALKSSSQNNEDTSNIQAQGHKSAELDNLAAQAAAELMKLTQGQQAGNAGGGQKGARVSLSSSGSATTTVTIREVTEQPSSPQPQAHQNAQSSTTTTTPKKTPNDIAAENQTAAQVSLQSNITAKEKAAADDARTKGEQEGQEYYDQIRQVRIILEEKKANITNISKQTEETNQFKHNNQTEFDTSSNKIKKFVSKNDSIIEKCSKNEESRKDKQASKAALKDLIENFKKDATKYPSSDSFIEEYNKKFSSNVSKNSKSQSYQAELKELYKNLQEIAKLENSKDKAQTSLQVLNEHETKLSESCKDLEHYAKHHSLEHQALSACNVSNSSNYKPLYYKKAADHYSVYNHIYKLGDATFAMWSWKSSNPSISNKEICSKIQKKEDLSNIFTKIDTNYNILSAYVEGFCSKIDVSGDSSDTLGD